MKLVKALVEAGFLEKDGNDYVIHQWLEHQGDIVKKRHEWKERQRRHRDKKDNVTRDERDGHASPIPSYSSPSLSLEEGSAPPTSEPDPDSGNCLTDVKGAFERIPKDRQITPSQTVDWLYKTAKGVGKIRGKPATIRDALESSIARYGAATVESWLWDPNNRGKDTNEMHDDLKKNGRPNERTEGARKRI